CDRSPCRSTTTSTSATARCARCGEAALPIPRVGPEDERPPTAPGSTPATSGGRCDAPAGPSPLGRAHARAHAEAMRETQIAAEAPVSALMADIIVKIPPTATMVDAADALSAGDVGLVAVMEGAKVLGVISERDIVGAVAHRDSLDRTLA